MIARYETKCPACRKRIRPGQQIDVKLGRARHLKCGTAPEGADRPPAKPVYARGCLTE